MFTTEQLKKLPLNYRSMRGREIEEKEDEIEKKVLQGFNFIEIEKLNTRRHIVVHFNKPISKLFNPNENTTK